LNQGQRGTTTIEFAVVAAAFFLLVFGIIEIGRAFFYFNTLTEATRRGARVAVICPISDASISQAAVFNAIAGDLPSEILTGLTAGDVTIEYLDEDGADVGDTSVLANYANIEFVRVAVNTNFTLDLLIPGLNISLPLPQYATVFLRESLGVPREGAVDDVQCT